MPRRVTHQLCSYGTNLCYSCVIAKEFCVWPYISFPCPCRLWDHFLIWIYAKQSCPMVLASSNLLQLGSLLHAGSPLNCVVPRREIIHLSFTLAYQQISRTPQNNLWSPFVRLDTWVRATEETPLSIWDPTPLLSTDRKAFLSEQLAWAHCFPFQMVVARGSGALCFTKWFPLDAKRKLFGSI